MVDLGAYIVVGIVATVVTALATPIVRGIARKRHWLAMPNERTVHSVPTPNIGGVAMFIGVVVSMSLLSKRREVRCCHQTRMRTDPFATRQALRQQHQ